MIYTLLIIVACIGIYFFTQSKSKESPTLPSTETSKDDKTAPSEKIPRIHTKIDVPMIRSRIEKLQATEGLTEHAKKKLDKLILTVCEGTEATHWWEPLRRFSQLPNASKGARFMFVNAASIEGQRITEFILNLSEMIRFCGLRLNGVETSQNEKITAFELEDGTYNIISAFGDDVFSIPFVIQDQTIDIPAFVNELNQTLSTKKATHRIVQLHPDGVVFCLLCTGYSEYKVSQRFL